jgi:hypothetical protein
MGWRQDLGNFDLSRLTFVGWLVFLLSLAAGITAAIVVGSYWDSVFPPQPGRNPRRTGPAGIAGVGGALGFFFAAKVLLQVTGVRLMRRKTEPSEITDEKEIADLRRRVDRARKWRLFFLLLMPVGFILPCGIALALVPASGQPEREGITASQIFGMTALAVPIIGFAGWLLMHKDAKKYTQALASAEQTRVKKHKGTQTA